MNFIELWCFIEGRCQETPLLKQYFCWLFFSKNFSSLSYLFTSGVFLDYFLNYDVSFFTVNHWAFLNFEHFRFFLTSTDFALQYTSFSQKFSMTSILFLSSFPTTISLQELYIFLVYLSPTASLFFTSYFL